MKINTIIRIVLCFLLIFLGGYQYIQGQEKMIDQDEPSTELNEPPLEGTSSTISQISIKERSTNEKKLKSTQASKPIKKQVDKKKVQQAKNNQKIERSTPYEKEITSIKKETSQEIRQNRRNPSVNNSLKNKNLKGPKNENTIVEKSNAKMTSKGSEEMGRKKRQERIQKIIEENKKKKALLKKEQ